MRARCAVVILIILGMVTACEKAKQSEFSELVSDNEESKSAAADSASPESVEALMDSLTGAATVVVDSVENEVGIQYDFRNTRWGMSYDEVIKSEPIDNISNDPNSISFQDEILEHKAGVAFNFVDHKLVEASMIFLEIMNIASLGDIARDIVDILKVKYGSPDRLKSGYAEWSTPRTFIVLQIHDSYVSVRYVGAVYAKKLAAEDAKAKAEEMNKF